MAFISKRKNFLNSIKTEEETVYVQLMKKQRRKTEGFDW